jgi:predicted PhzF superfamily epimerase YddE/YHI9
VTAVAIIRGEGSMDETKTEMFALDVPRAQRVATLLLSAHRKGGIFGVKQGEMPENNPPQGIARGDENHLLPITLTTALDYMRDNDQLWEAAMRSYAYDRTRYLFDPRAVALSPYQKVVADMQLHRLSLKLHKDAST